MYLVSFEEWMSEVFVKALGWTLAHSLWQGLLALVIAYVLMGIMKKAAPHARYHALLFISVIFLCSVLFTSFYEMHQATKGESLLIKTPSIQIPGDNNIHSSTPVIINSQRALGFVQDLFNQYMPVIVTLWFIIVCVQWFRLFMNLNYVNRITHFASKPADDKWQSLLNELKTKLGIEKPVRFLQSNIIKIPVVYGFLKPAILIPAGLLANMSPELIESVLLHELAHVRRRDYLVNLLQSAVQTLFFFNPFILKIFTLIRDEREACCDKIAVDVLKNKVNYVEALMAFGKYSTDCSPALAFSDSRFHLLQRVKRILYNQNKTPGVMEKSILFFSLVLLFLLTAFSYRKGTEKILNTGIINKIQSIATDTIPDKKSDTAEANPSDKIRNKSRESEVKIELKQKEIEEIQKKIEKDHEKILKEAAKAMELKQKELVELMERQSEIQNKLSEQQINELVQLSNEKAQKIIKSVDLQKLQLDVQLKDLEKQLAQQEQIFQLPELRELQLQKGLLDSLNTSIRIMNDNYTGNSELDEILEFIESNKISKSADVKSFVLNNNEFIVNDKKQPSSLHDKLKDRFIKDKSDYIRFSRSGGTTTINIHRS